jgi:hypothetical protein
MILFEDYYVRFTVSAEPMFFRVVFELKTNCQLQHCYFALVKLARLSLCIERLVWNNSKVCKMLVIIHWQETYG